MYVTDKIQVHASVGYIIQDQSCSHIWSKKRNGESGRKEA